MNKPPAYQQRGSALMMIFVAIALLGAITFALLQGSRTSSSNINKVADDASATQSRACTNELNMAVKRLQLRGCASYISFNEDGSNTMEGAPEDGSCSVYHVNGGGIKPCASNYKDCSTTQLSSLNIGDRCGGVVYAGLSPDGGKRMYTTMSIATAMPWNDGIWGHWYATNLTSQTAGKSNTQTLASMDSDSDTAGIQPHTAAAYCSNLVMDGFSDWYLPAQNEMQVLWNNRNTIGGFPNVDQWPASHYSTSTEANTENYMVFNSYWNSFYALEKENAVSVRCVRRDN